ncbi:DUF1446 domain-containing protein [Alcaligenaceae bacterium]|nr:DUF1446 domain-containing protein [Alcaligenaceae bacterium]
MATRQRHHNDRVIIGGASGFWGDSSIGPVQLVQSGRLDYLVFDYLAELTMSLLASARLKKPEAGYATDFVTTAMRQVLQDVVRQGIRVVANAGGVNPAGCAQALRALAKELGVEVKVAEVHGDDFMPQWQTYRETAAPTDMQSGLPLPAQLVTANAYLGALPIKAALDAGADIVVTGRCVDSAITLGVLMHEFQWSAQDWDRLAGGSLAGHIIECGCQATGGLFTDWRDVPDWPNIGYPIIECAEDGSFRVTKPEGTGGLVSVPVVSEQLLYEIGDPRHYILPDVICDFSQVHMTQVAPNVVDVRGAMGRPPTDTYKVSATFTDGFRTQAQLTIIGHEATQKAQRTAEAILARVRTRFTQLGLPDFSAAYAQVVGTAQCLGPHSPALDLFEVVMRLAVRHSHKEALQLFVREIAAAGTSWAPGTTSGGGGRASVSINLRHCAFLVPKELLQPTVALDGAPVALPLACRADGSPELSPYPSGPELAPQPHWVPVPLLRLAHARSGDKGNHSNIGVVARNTADLPLLRGQLTEAAVKRYLAHLVQGRVTRYELPGIGALNFLCEQALDGGGMSSLRNDPLGKGMGQTVLAMPVYVPPEHPATMQ